VIGKKLTPHWRVFGWSLVAFAAIGALVLHLAPGVSGLFLFALYAIPSNSLLPVPHEPGLLYFAHYYGPTSLAIAGCIGTMWAGFLDYPAVAQAFKHPKLHRMRHTRVYQLAVRWLMRWPFGTIFTFALTPLPIYVVRVLAPASGYPFWRYQLAVALGRFPRFFIVALVGHHVRFPMWMLAVLFVVMLAGTFAGGRLIGRGAHGGIDPVTPIVEDEPADADPDENEGSGQPDHAADERDERDEDELASALP
jgi:membrane protein YqaA with SNARE-associated domain